MNTCQIIIGDCIESMRSMPAESIQCCVTSPPYWGLRDYGHAGQIGLEDTPEAYVARMVEVFREVRRVLREDGTLWLNLGDSYNGSGGIGGAGKQHTSQGCVTRPDNRAGWSGLKPKDLVGIPWRVAFALQADGWWLRQDIIWHKPNPMPESVTDRCTKAHEYVFLMAKSERYFYDNEPIREAVKENADGRMAAPMLGSFRPSEGARRQNVKQYDTIKGANRRSVWTVTTKPYSGAHFATFPPDLILPMILAGTRQGDTVLDPFGGSGTTGQVALEQGRNAILCELNPDYAELARERTRAVHPVLALPEGVKL